MVTTSLRLHLYLCRVAWAANTVLGGFQCKSGVPEQYNRHMVKESQTGLGSLALGKQPPPVSPAIQWEGESLLTGASEGVEAGACRGAPRHTPAVT